MKKHPTINALEMQNLKSQGHTFTNASLYEPDHAHKDALFVHVDYGKSFGTQFKRINKDKEHLNKNIKL